MKKNIAIILSTMLVFGGSYVNLFANQLNEVNDNGFTNKQDEETFEDYVQGDNHDTVYTNTTSIQEVSLQNAQPFLEKHKLAFGSSIDVSENISYFKDNKDITFLIKFRPTGSGIGSLISVSDNTKTNSHFHIYSYGDVLGYELRGASGGDVNGTSIGVKASQDNTLAFKINSINKKFEVFLNGNKIIEDEFGDRFKSIDDIPNLNTVSIGKTDRSTGNEYNFSGEIKELKVYKDSIFSHDLLEYSSQTEYEKFEQIFKQEISKAKYYRIPALYTLNNGDVMASIDARFASSADSPNNIDIATRILKNGSSEWSDVDFPFYFNDYADEAGYNSKSASFIDTNIVQGLDDKIHLTVDVFPSGYGYPNAKAGSGYKTIDGKKYLALTKRGKSTTDFSNFDHYIKDGIVYDSNNIETEYSVDGKLNLFKNGEPLMIQQRNVRNGYTGVKVPMNIFYDDSDFKVYSTSYLWTISSDDGGLTWSEPTDLNYLKNENERFMGTGPGRGITITEGEYRGRILIPIYSNLNGERASVVYSDDNGQTWNRGNSVTMSSTSSPGKASEAQLIQLPDGTVRMYARGSTQYIGYADSFDGGVTFEPMQQDLGLKYGHNGSGCMISVINYSSKIDGKDAIILSSPEGSGRNNGVIRVGLIDEYIDADGKTRYGVEWKYKTTVNQGEFQYSCLTELPNGNVAILYETAPSASTSVYKEYTIDLLTQN